MWQKSKSDRDSSEESLEEEVEELLSAAKEFKDRDLYESELNVFINSVKFGHPVPNNLMQFVADTVEALISSKNTVKVSDALGPGPKGSRGKKSLGKQKHQKKIAQMFALNKLEGMSRADNLEATANKCGVTTRTIENVIRDCAIREPFFKYRENEKI